MWTSTSSQQRQCRRPILLIAIIPIASTRTWISYVILSCKNWTSYFKCCNDWSENNAPRAAIDKQNVDARNNHRLAVGDKRPDLQVRWLCFCFCQRNTTNYFSHPFSMSTMISIVIFWIHSFKSIVHSHSSQLQPRYGNLRLQTS